MRRVFRLLPALTTGVCLVSLLVARPHAENIGEWPSYGVNKASSKYAPLSHLTRDNVQQLRVAWRWLSVDQSILQADPSLWTMVYEATPLMVGGVLYTSTSLSQVAAIEAATGKTLWVYDPKSYQHGSPPNLGFVHRGVAYWQDGADQRILIATGDAHLIALDAKTGQPLEAFGDQGRIDLTHGLRRPVSRTYYGVSSPPIVCRDVVVVGSSIWDYPSEQAMPPGDVRGFDVRTGAPRWTFHSVPQGGEVGSETWKHESWKHVGNTNVWTTMSCDEELGYVYLPFSTPSNDYYGGQRLGHNLFAESLVALQAQTGQRVWHFQMVHDITVDSKRIRAVAQVSKQGFCYVFDRVTGEPVWPIEERPVPPSTVPGEQASPTQPFPTKPLPFDRQGVTPQDLIDFTPELHQEALEVLTKYAMDWQDAEAFYDEMIERKAYLFPDEIQPEGAMTMFMRKEVEYLITPFEESQLTLSDPIIPPNGDDATFVKALEELDARIDFGEDYGDWESNFFEMKDLCCERYHHWLRAKGVPQTFSQQLSFCIEPYLTFIYQCDAGSVLDVWPDAIEEFFMDWLMRKVMVKPPEYPQWPPALRLFYRFLSEKGYLDDPEPMLKGLYDIEPEFIELVKSRS